MSQTINLGSVTAYASAVEGGYTGTYAEFCEATANVAEIGELQSATLPTPSEDRAGQVLQYIGDTTSDYIHGYFYECVENNSDFEWVNVPLASGKADKVTNATSGNLAALDSNGNLTDSGKSKSATIPSGGTTGQVLKKKSGTNYDTEWATPTDTKNTAGSTDSSSKLFLIGATSQAANPQTYSQDTAYVGTDGNLYSGSKVVATQNMIGDAWVTSHAYAVGDYCIDGNVLYKCKTAHTSSASNRPPYASYWGAKSVASELNGTVTFTPNTTNAPRYSYSLTQVGNLVAGVINVAPNSGSSYSANTWYEVGTISKVPSINGSTSGFEGMSRFCATIAGTGAYGGMADINSDGKVKVYPATIASSLSINLAYKTS